LPACQAIEPYLVAAPVIELPPDDSKWRPFGQNAKLPDPGGPAVAQQSTIVPGTGVFVGSTKPARTDRRGGEEQSYTLNLVNTTVPEAAKAVLGDIFGVNYIVDPKLDARVTVQTSTPLTRAGIGELFEAALRTNGIAVVQTGNVYRVVTADQAAMGAQLSSGVPARGSPSIGNSARIIQLQFISPVEMKRILDPLAAFGGVVRVDEARNALVVSGTEQEVASMEEAVAVFDVDVMRGMSFALVPVSAVEPDAIVEDLNKIFSSNREGPMAGMVQFVANKRLKSILVISKQPRYLRQAEQWVRRLDARAVGTQRQLYTYVLRNRQAKEVVEILQSIFAAETASGDQANRGDVAPRFRRSSTEAAAPQAQSTPQFSTAANPAGSQTLVQQSFSAFGVSPRQPSTANSGSTTEDAGVTAGAGIVPDTDGEPRIKIVVDVPNNALVIRATQADYKRVERVIANLDIVPNQVLIEATICEVSLTDDLQFGVRWFVRSKGGTQASTFSSAIDGAINSVFPGFSWIYKAGSTQVTLNALNSLTRVNVLASPALMVLDGRTASLQIGDQVPITTQTATSVITPGAPVVNSVSYKDTGVILSVTPRINEAGRVMLEIEQEVSSVTQTTSSNIDSPTFGRRRVKTTVLVNDGEAITLGGLIQNKKTYTADQVPVLGNIPLLGSAFKDKGDKIEKTELVILLTPKVVRDLTEAQQVTSEYRRKVGEFAPRRRDPVRQFEHDVKRTLR
jgi:general secretion pathway protein D